MKKLLLGTVFFLFGLFMFHGIGVNNVFAESMEKEHINRITGKLIMGLEQKNKDVAKGIQDYISVLEKISKMKGMKKEISGLLLQIKNSLEVAYKIDYSNGNNANDYMIDYSKLDNNNSNNNDNKDTNNGDSQEIFGEKTPEQIEEMKKEFIRILNEYRLKNGARRVGRNLQLEVVPNEYLNEIYPKIQSEGLHHFNHQRPDGTGASYVNSGYQLGYLTGEILTGPSVKNAQFAFDNFKNSNNHNKAMLWKPAKDIGLAYKNGFWIINITTDFESFKNEYSVDWDNYDYKSYVPENKDRWGNIMTDYEE